MSEFKFACPHCQQNIQATPEYVGMQINCPRCQQVITVPEAPVTGVPSKPVGSKLSKAPSTVEQPATSATTQQQVVRQAKKKVRWGLYAGIAGGAVAIGLLILLIPKGMEKFQEHKDEVAKQQAATNAPPPPPPDLEAPEIIKKIAETYKKMTSYGGQANVTGTFDRSQVTPSAKGPQDVTEKLSFLLGRPASYRFEWDREEGTKKYDGAVWSAGKGDFIRVGNRAMRMPDTQTAMMTAEAPFELTIPPLLFVGENGFPLMFRDYEKKPNETIDGHKCYVLEGHIGFADTTIWVHKDDFLVVQAEVKLTGQVDDAMLAGLNAGQRNQVEKVMKLKGDLTVVFENLEVNKANNNAFGANLGFKNGQQKVRPRAAGGPGHRKQSQ